MPSVPFLRRLDYINRRVEELAEILMASGWKYNENSTFWANHEVTVGLEREPRLSAGTTADVPESRWKFFRFGSYPLRNWRGSYIAYGKQIAPSSHLIDLVRLLYERFSGRKMAEIIVAVCGEEKPVFAFVPYRGNHAKFLVAPYPAQRINPEDSVYDLARDRFVRWEEYLNRNCSNPGHSSHEKRSLLDFI